MTDVTRAILAAVARADLILQWAQFYLRAVLPGLLTGGLLWLVISREERK